jgi:hypothetical protein
MQSLEFVDGPLELGGTRWFLSRGLYVVVVEFIVHTIFGWWWRVTKFSGTHL